MKLDNLEFDAEKTRDKLIMEAAKSAHGYVYYEPELKRTRCKDGSWHTRVDVYERYQKPNRKSAKLLKSLGIESQFHPRS